MNKRIQKGIVFIAAMGVVINVSALNVSAAPDVSDDGKPVEQNTGMDIVPYAMTGSIHRTSEGHSFTESWQASAYASGGDASLIYGFNTFLINEDYAWANHSKKEHSADLRNANGAHGTQHVKAGKEARIEVVHSGNAIQYQNSWFD